MARRGNLIAILIRQEYYAMLSLTIAKFIKPSPSGRVGRGVFPDNGLLLDESGKTMAVCGRERGKRICLKRNGPVRH
jgi:hypothetical protein